MQGLLRGFDWSNVVSAGGSVVSALTGVVPEGDADVDLFVWGIPLDRHRDQYWAKIRQIYRLLVS